MTYSYRQSFACILSIVHFSLFTHMRLLYKNRSPAIAGIVLRELRSGTPAPGAELPELSRRERQILEGLAHGYTYQDIADQLHLSYHTVSDHTKSIYRKLQVSSQSELFARFLATIG